MEQGEERATALSVVTYTSVRLPVNTPAERRAAAHAAVERYRSRITWAADALIPADPSLGMPSAVEAGLLETYLPEALTARDDMLHAFVSAVEQLSEQPPPEPLAAMQALPEGGFDTISRTIAGAYFWSEDINRKLKYPGQETIRETPDYDSVLDAIAPQIERGARYVPTP